MKLTGQTVKAGSAMTLVALLAACSSAPKQQPALSSSADPATVAKEYVALENGKKLPQSGNLVITSCNVAFGKKTRASASTQAGALNRDNRVEAKVSSELILEGVEDQQLNKIASMICADAQQTLAAAGYTVVSASDNQQFQLLQTNGKPSPHEWDHNKSEYAVFAPSGMSVWDDRFLGIGGGLKAAFKAAKGTNSNQLVGGVVNATQATGAALHFVVAFASSEGDKGKRSIFATKDTAKVSHDTRMMVTGELSFLPLAQIKCWERFGKTECMPQGNTPKVITHKPLIAAEQAYVSIRDAQSTGSKIAEGAANVFSLLAAASGIGGASTIDIQQRGVQVDPTVYERVARDYSRKFMQMAMAVR